MALTQEEKLAGRLFREASSLALVTLNETDPPGAVCSPWSPPYFRHECGKRNGTTALALKTKRSFSPARENIPEARFSFAWLEGRCASCQFTVRSGSGYLEVNEGETGG